MPPGKRAIHTETTVLPSRPGSAKRSPPRAAWSHSLGRRPVTAPTSAAASAAPSAQNSLTAVGGDAAAVGARPLPPRAKSPPTAASARAQKGGGRPTSPSGFRRPPSTRRGARRRTTFSLQKEEGSDAEGGPLGPTRSPTCGPSAPPRARAARASLGPSRRERLAAVPALAPLLCGRAGARPRPPLRRAVGQGRRRPPRPVRARRRGYGVDPHRVLRRAAVGARVRRIARARPDADGLRRGRGRTCRNDLALFSLKRESRAGDIPKEGAGMWEHPLGQNAPPDPPPGPRGGASTSRSVLVFGGHSTDDDGWCEAAPWTATVVPSAVALPSCPSSRRRAPASRAASASPSAAAA